MNDVYAIGDRNTITSIEQAHEAVEAPAELGFTKFPNAVLRDSNLSVPARLTYAMVASFAYGDKDYCFPGQETLAQHLGVSTRKVRDYLNELVEAGYLEKKRRGFNLTNVYTLKSLTNGSDRNDGSDQSFDQRGEVSDNGKLDRNHGSDLARNDGSDPKRNDGSDKEDKVNKTRLIKQVATGLNEFSGPQVDHASGNIDPSSDKRGPAHDVEDKKDSTDIFGDIESRLEKMLDEPEIDPSELEPRPFRVFDPENLEEQCGYWHDEDEDELDEDNTPVLGEDLPRPVVELQERGEDSAAFRLARGIARGKNSPQGPITCENVARAVLDDLDAAELEDMDLPLGTGAGSAARAVAALLIETVSEMEKVGGRA